MMLFSVTICAEVNAAHSCFTITHACLSLIFCEVNIVVGFGNLPQFSSQFEFIKSFLFVDQLEYVLAP